MVFKGLEIRTCQNESIIQDSRTHYVPGEGPEDTPFTYKIRKVLMKGTQHPRHLVVGSSIAQRHWFQMVLWNRSP